MRGGDVTKKKNHTEAGGNVRKVCLCWVRGRRETGGKGLKIFSFFLNVREWLVFFLF